MCGMTGHEHSDVGEESRRQLDPIERRVLLLLAGCVEDMVPLVDITSDLAGLPNHLRGQWFDRKLLTPSQASAWEEALKQVRRAVRSLFRKRFIDVGREDHFPEGFCRHHAEVIRALQNHPAWKGDSDISKRSVAGIESEIRARMPWAEARDLTAVQKQMGGPVDIIGITSSGRAELTSNPGQSLAGPQPF